MKTCNLFLSKKHISDFFLFEFSDWTIVIGVFSVIDLSLLLRKQPL